MWSDVERRLLVESYVSKPRPAFTRLPFDYRRVPSPVRSAALAVLERLATRSDGTFPRWPAEPALDDAREQAWKDAAATADLELVGPRWPDARPAAVLLTHDVDSAGELEVVAPLRAMEAEFGFRSSFGFIPWGSWPGRQVIEALADEGGESYCHDERHDGRLPYRSENDIRRVFERLFERDPWARPLVRGFRAGQLLMSPTLLSVVADVFDYDLTLPDTERGGPYGATAGCATVFPFFVDGMLEVPLTLPQDYYLLHVERMGAAAMASLWSSKLGSILDRGGVAVINTHPVWINPRRVDAWQAYREFLGRVAESGAWVTTPSNLRQWLTSLA